MQLMVPKMGHQRHLWSVKAGKAVKWRDDEARNGPRAPSGAVAERQRDLRSKLKQWSHPGSASAALQVPAFPLEGGCRGATGGLEADGVPSPANEKRLA